MVHITLSAAFADKLKGIARSSNISTNRKGKITHALVANDKLGAIAGRLPVRAVVKFEGKKFRVTAAGRLKLAA